MKTYSNTEREGKVGNFSTLIAHLQNLSPLSIFPLLISYQSLGTPLLILQIKIRDAIPTRVSVQCQLPISTSSPATHRNLIESFATAYFPRAKLPPFLTRATSLIKLILPKKNGGEVSSMGAVSVYSFFPQPFFPLSPNLLLILLE